MTAVPPCPVCKAQNPGGPACRRCKADLSLVLAAEARRDYELAAARAAFRAGDADAGLAGLRRADALRRGDDTRRLLTAALMLRRDFAAAAAAWAAR